MYLPPGEQRRHGGRAPQRAEGAAPQRLAGRQRRARLLRGERGRECRQRVRRIARDGGRDRLRRAPRAGQKAEHATRFGKRGACSLDARGIQRARQQRRIGTRGIEPRLRLDQRTKRRRVAGPGGVRHRSKIMFGHGGDGSRDGLQRLDVTRPGCRHTQGRRERREGRRTTGEGADQLRQAGHQPVRLARGQVARHTNEGAPRTGGADGQFAQRIAVVFDPRRVPAAGLQRQRARLHPARAESGEPPDHRMQRQPALPDDAAHRLGMAVDPAAQGSQAPHHRIALHPRRRRARERGAQLIQHRALGLLLAVQLQAGSTEAHLRQPALHDLERRELLRHEQHAAPVQHRLGDDVGDGLAFPRPRWPLDHQVPAATDGFDCQRLAAIDIHDVIQPLDRDDGVHIGIVGKAGHAGGQRLAADQRTDQRVREQARIGRRVQVPPHQELREGEQADGERIRLHPPLRLPGDDAGHRLGPLRRVIGLGVEGGQRHTVLRLQHLAQGEVVRHLRHIRPQSEHLGHALALQRDGEQRERGEALGLRCRRVAPGERADREVQRRYARFLARGAGIGENVAQAPRQILGRHAHAQLGVRLPRLARRGRIGRAHARGLGGGLLACPAPRLARRRCFRRRRIGFATGHGFTPRDGFKREGRALAQLRDQDVSILIIEDDDPARPAGLGQREQPVARGQVEQSAARILKRLGQGGHAQNSSEAPSSRRRRSSSRSSSCPMRCNSSSSSPSSA